MRVFKYAIPISDDPFVRMPVGAKILSVGQQQGHPFLWALVDPGQETTERRQLRLAGTGHEITETEELTFLGTIHMANGALVLHVFERIPMWLRSDRFLSAFNSDVAG